MLTDKHEPIQDCDCHACAVAERDRLRGAQPTKAARIATHLPNPGSPAASAMIDSVLAEYGWPANPKNAARAGYVAAQRLMGPNVANEAGQTALPLVTTPTTRPAV